MPRLIRLFSVRGVPVLVHWTVFAICLFLLGAAVRHIVLAAIGLASYIGVLVVHELGHQWMATRRGYDVHRIEIYPIHGLCRFEAPEYALDEAVIAWGGVLAQFAVALPLFVYLKAFGYPGFAVLDIPFAIFAFVSPAIALLNLLPVAPLDGKTAWSYFRYRFSRVEVPAAARPADKSALQALQDAVAKAKQTR